VRVRDTILACDASAGSDLIFLSHAGALDARAARALPRARAGRRQILTTDLTLTLLGPARERLRPHALLAGLGRPFALGELRLELFPSGHGPGAASLLCELGASGRRIVYAGVIGPGVAGSDGSGPAPAVRPAEALCLDATFGARRFAFPEPAEALDQVRRLVQRALADGRAPVVLAEPPGPGLAVAAALAAAGVPVRAHRAFILAAAVFGEAGLPVPPLQRFDGHLRPGEALLWPPHARDAARLGMLRAPFVLLASGWASDPAEVARARADAGVAFSDQADFAALVRYVTATGATEVALRHAPGGEPHAPGGELMAELRARGIDAYPLGAPSQIALFAPPPAQAAAP
jgi:putative mRNA 3-end processing factor